jgi:hypothetical protein
MGPMPYWTAVEYDQGEQPWHQLITCFRYKSADERKAVRTTNAIERPFREVRRRTRHDGHIPGHNVNGSHPVRSLHPRKQITGRRYPSSADTEQLTSPELLDQVFIGTAKRVPYAVGQVSGSRP